MPWIDVEETPETKMADVLIDQVMAIRRKLTDRLAGEKSDWNEHARRRLVRRLQRLDDLAAVQSWLVVWRDTLWQIPGVAWRPLA